VNSRMSRSRSLTSIRSTQDMASRERCSSALPEMTPHVWASESI